MSQAIQKIIEYFQFPFVRYAFITGVLIALCSSLLGVTLVLRRFSFIGDGLSHVAFGAMAVAAILNLTNEMSLILGVGVGENFFASDVTALVSHTRNVIYLEDGEFASLTPDGITVYDCTGQKIM